MRILVTRPTADCDRTMAIVANAGHDPIACPVMTIHLMPEAEIPDNPYVAVIATSRHAIECLADRADAGLWRTLPIACVGSATAATARNSGFETIVDGGGDATALLSAIKKRSWKGDVLYVCGAVVSRNLATDLGEAGINLIQVPIYDMVPVESLPLPAIEALAKGPLDGALFYSSQTVSVFAALLAETGYSDRLNGLTAWCLSDGIGSVAHSVGFNQVIIADEKSETALVASLGAVR